MDIWWIRLFIYVNKFFWEDLFAKKKATFVSFPSVRRENAPEPSRVKTQSFKAIRRASSPAKERDPAIAAGMEEDKGGSTAAMEVEDAGGVPAGSGDAWELLSMARQLVGEGKASLALQAVRNPCLDATLIFALLENGGFLMDWACVLLVWMIVCLLFLFWLFLF